MIKAVATLFFRVFSEVQTIVTVSIAVDSVWHAFFSFPCQLVCPSLCLRIPVRFVDKWC